MGSALENEIDQLRGVLWSERDPQGRVFVSLADAYRRMGDLPLAKSMIEEGLERLPDFASAHVVAGWIHQDLVSPVEAEEAFRRVLDLDPENTIALEAMGGLAGARGSHAEAAEYQRRLSALDPRAGGEDGADPEVAGEVAEVDGGQSSVDVADPDGGDELAAQTVDEDAPSLVETLGAAAAVTSAGILLDDAEGEDDSHFETLALEADPTDDDASAEFAIDELAPDDDDATVEIAVADLAPDDDVAAEISVAELAPEDEHEDAVGVITVAELAPEDDGDVASIAVADLAPAAAEGDLDEVQDGPDPLAAVPVAELAPEPAIDSDALGTEAVDVGELAPWDDEAAAAQIGVPITELAPEQVAAEDTVAAEEPVSVGDLAPDEAAEEDVPFDFAVADLSAEASPAVAEVADESEEAESWVEPVGEFLAQEAVGEEEPVDEGLSVSNVFRSLLGYEPIPASEELTDGEAEPVADWNWSPVEVDEAGVQGAQEDGATSVEAEGAPDEVAGAPEGDPSPEDSDEPGPDDFQAWLERNSL